MTTLKWCLLVRVLLYLIKHAPCDHANDNQEREELETLLKDEQGGFQCKP